jgi:isopentenyl phosphate kinase
VRIVSQLLNRGLVPVVHGDVVLCPHRGVRIMRHACVTQWYPEALTPARSGDELVEQLACALRPPRAVFVTDVAGVFTRPPHEPGAEVCTLRQRAPVV